LVQQAIRTTYPDIKGDWQRFEFEGKTITFSLSDQAISEYKPKIQEFSSFGSAVRMFGAYESYIRKTVDLTSSILPAEIQSFKKGHKGHITKRNDSFVKSEVGRGIDFFQEVFDYNPDPAYRPSLEFLYQLRNIAVHNSGIVDERLLDAADDPHIIIGGTLTIGMKLDWNLSSVLQLQDLLLNMLPQIDPLVCSKLGLPQIERQAYWYSNAET